MELWPSARLKKHGDWQSPVFRASIRQPASVEEFVAISCPFTVSTSPKTCLLRYTFPAGGYPRLPAGVAFAAFAVCGSLCRARVSSPARLLSPKQRCGAPLRRIYSCPGTGSGPRRHDTAGAASGRLLREDQCNPSASPPPSSSPTPATPSRGPPMAERFTRTIANSAVRLGLLAGCLLWRRCRDTEQPRPDAQPLGRVPRPASRLPLTLAARGACALPPCSGESFSLRPGGEGCNFRKPASGACRS